MASYVSVPVWAIHNAVGIGPAAALSRGCKRVSRTWPSRGQAQNVGRLDGSDAREPGVRVPINFPSVFQQGGPRDVQAVGSGLPAEADINFADRSHAGRDVPGKCGIN